MNVFVLTLFFLLGGTTGQTGTTCPDDWWPIHGSCYYFSNFTETFYEAEVHCQRRRAHLVHVEDEIENSFLKAKMDTMKKHAWWLGLSDDRVEGLWEWVDTGIAANFTDFQPGDGGHHNSEDCAVFHPDSSYRWKDYACSGQFYPLCEMEPLECGDLGIIG